MSTPLVWCPYRPNPQCKENYELLLWELRAGRGWESMSVQRLTQCVLYAGVPSFTSRHCLAP